VTFLPKKINKDKKALAKGSKTFKGTWKTVINVWYRLKLANSKTIKTAYWFNLYEQLE